MPGGEHRRGSNGRFAREPGYRVRHGAYQGERGVTGRQPNGESASKPGANRARECEGDAIYPHATEREADQRDPGPADDLPSLNRQHAENGCMKPGAGAHGQKH